MTISISEPPSPGGGSIKSRLLEKARDLGFDSCGITTPDGAGPAGERLRHFLQQGRHGDMAWMANNADRRADARVLWPAARSIVMLGVNYHRPPAASPEGAVIADYAEGREGAVIADYAASPEGAVIADYAEGRDYHDLIKKRLKRLGRWLIENHGGEIKVFVDTAPLMEKPLAAAAGLGWQGKHTNLVSRQFGSWLFLGALLSTLKLPADGPARDHCGGCRRCLDACPTDAFPGPYQLDARRCISYLTIEHKGVIPAPFRAPMGGRIFGCDDCLQVCPWNKFARQSQEAAFVAQSRIAGLSLTDLAALGEDDFRTLFRGTPLRRLGHVRFLRNVLIAIGNAGDAAALDVVRTRLAHPAPLVRGMAVWAAAQLLNETEFSQLRARHLTAETDPEVRQEWRRGGSGKHRHVKVSIMVGERGFEPPAPTSRT